MRSLKQLRKTTAIYYYKYSVSNIHGNFKIRKLSFNYYFIMTTKLAVFDMDGTLIDGRVIFSLSEKLGFSDKVKQIQAWDLPGYLKTGKIAGLLRGIEEKEIWSATASVPLMKNSEFTVSELRKRGFRIGMITDSYTIAAEFVAKRLSLDFFVANELELKDGIITGKINMPRGWEQIDCFCKLSVCKRYHLEKHAAAYGIPVRNTLAVGDTRSDMCMIQRAGVGIAFMPKDPDVARITDKIIYKPDMSGVLDIVDNCFKA